MRPLTKIEINSSTFEQQKRNLLFTQAITLNLGDFSLSMPPDELLPEEKEGTNERDHVGEKTGTATDEWSNLTRWMMAFTILSFKLSFHPYTMIHYSMVQ